MCGHNYIYHKKIVIQTEEMRIPQGVLFFRDNCIVYYERMVILCLYVNFWENCNKNY